MKIDKQVKKVLKQHKKYLDRNDSLKSKKEKYESLLEKGYIEKKSYSLSRLDTIGYNTSAYIN